MTMWIYVGGLADYVADYESQYVHWFGTCCLNAVGMILAGWNLSKRLFCLCCLEGLTDEM